MRQWSFGGRRGHMQWCGVMGLILSGQVGTITYTSSNFSLGGNKVKCVKLCKLHARRRCAGVG